MASTKRRDTKSGQVQRASQLVFAARVILSVVGVTGALNASASLVTINQSLSGNYTYLPPCAVLNGFVCESGPPVPTQAQITTLNNTGLNPNGRSQLDANDVNGASKVRALWEVDVDNAGTIKTYSNLQVAGRDPFTEPDANIDALQKIDVTARNRISFFDTVTTDDLRGNIFRFETRITGKFGVDRDYQTLFEYPTGLSPDLIDRPAVFEHKAEIGAESSAAGGGIVTSKEEWVFRDFGPQSAKIKSDEYPVDFSLRFIDILANDEGDFIFAFEFSDELRFELNNPDGDYWEIGMANDLLNTITTYASVYDKDGNLLPDARVVSSLGFSYAPLSDLNGDGGGGSSNVPAPSPAFLIAAGLLGMRLRRR